MAPPASGGLEKQRCARAHHGAATDCLSLESELMGAGEGDGGGGGAPCATAAACFTREQQGPTAQHTALRSGSRGRRRGWGRRDGVCVCAAGPFIIYQTLTTLLRTN